eukprot:TRINITY_DN106436_c0_g1_i1.p1 TRINITY_DN106436_c0_g1~~TRINITY_DN106436_c0_g1_i1.p1  ORF type:complete len:629 (-),score=86.26 TRINITY_DN106436_c0_g1_i1:184-1959(-)
MLLPCNTSSLTACIIKPPNGWIMWPFYSLVDVPNRTAAASRHNSSHCSCRLPPADAEAPADVFFKVGDDVHPKPAGHIQYVAIWTTALSRRPYLSTDDHADVVVGIHSSVSQAHVSVLLPDGSFALKDAPVPSGAASSLAFPLAGVPLVVHNQPLVIILNRTGGAPLRRNLFLSRVEPPPSTLRSFVQVDYARKTVLVNGKPLLGVGYYDSQSIGPSNFSRQASAGINWGMRYLSSNDPKSTDPRLPNQFVQDYLDWSSKAGMYVMLDIYMFVEDIAAHGNTTDAWRNISEQVMMFRDHPALLGWYICDDCMTQWLRRQLSAKTRSISTIYDALKQLDPWHPLIGASETAQNGIFTTANVYVPSPSLDVIMIENYVPALEQNAHSGLVGDPGMDGTLRAWPMTWEPVVNCPGPWLIAKRQDISDSDKALIMYSMSWLSAIKARQPSQLHFRLFPFPSNPIYEEIMRQVGRYGNIAREVQDFLLAPPSGEPEPWLSSSELGGCQQCAGLWRRAGKSFCALIVVTNTRNVTATASFQLRDAERWPDAGMALFERVDSRSAGLKLHDSRFDVVLAAFDTHVYATASCQNKEVYV